MIRNIIFDIGNVLVDFCWEEYLGSFGFPQETAEKIAKATVLDEAWNEFDRGGKEEEELVDDFVKNAPELENEIRQICEDVHDMLRKRDYAIPWVQELKKMGYHVYYLSNFSKKAERECAHTLGFIPYMDGGILSYRVKRIKPNPEIYQMLMERYQLVPEECVFLDDRKDNCAAAEKLGIHAIVFTTKENAIEELKKLGVY
jgi:putative hydrolase of the HAD superfamily